MDSADSPRRGDRDGRGNLSEAALIEFSEWFLSVMLDQIRFSKAIFQLDKIQERYKGPSRGTSSSKPARSTWSAASIFKFGQMERGDAARNVLRMPERTARTVVSKLTQQGFLKSSTPKGPVRVAFPWSTASDFFRTCSPKEKSTCPNRRHCSSGAEDSRGLDRSNRASRTTHHHARGDGALSVGPAQVRLCRSRQERQIRSLARLIQRGCAGA